MTRQRAYELVRGVAALSVLVVLVVGPPLGLVRFVGWPLPTTIPSFGEVEQAVRVGIDDRTVVKAVAILVWLAWAHVAVIVVTEAAAAVRGRAAGRRSFVPGLQVAVGRLVASAALVATTNLNSLSTPVGAVVGDPEPVAQLLPAPPPEPATTILDSGGHRSLLATVRPRAVGVVQDREPLTLEVRRHDSWWAIAERTLGDGLRWREIRDANVGRTMADGHTITADSELLRPGWRIHLPAEAVAEDADGADPSPESTTSNHPASPERPPADDDTGDMSRRAEVVVVAGDSMWRIAERHLTSSLGRPANTAEIATYWADCIEANRDRFVDRANPDLIYPGQRFVLPALRGVLDTTGSPETGVPHAPGPPDRSQGEDAAPPTPPPPERPSPDTTPEPAAPQQRGAPHAPSTTIEPARPTEPARPVPDVAEPAPASEREPDEGEDDRSLPQAVVVAGIASAALAVGVTRAIRRRRRRRDHQAPTTAPVAGGDQDLHRKLVVDADEDTIDTLSHALDSLASQVAAAGQTCRPRVVQFGANHLDVLLDQPTVPAAQGWEAQAQGAIWTVDPTQPGVQHLDTPLMAAPLLVTIGEPDDGGQLYLELETAGVVSLTGDLDVAHDLARTLLTELALSPFAANAQIVLVGDLGVDRIADLDGVSVVDDWTAITADLAAWADQSREALAANGWPNPFVARGHRPDHDALIPLIVIATEHPDNTDVLGAVQLGATAAAVVTIGDPLPGATVIDCKPEELSLPQVGLACRPKVVSPEHVGGIVDLMDVAEDTSGDQLSFALDPTERFEPPHLPNGEDEPYSDPPYEILVRLLGDITVETANGTRPLTGKQTALVAYIALHGTVSTDRVIDAVWVSASAVSPRKRLANTITKCRGALGARHLPVAKDNRYSIGPDVATDVDLFEQRVVAAAEMPPERAVETLRSALDLVRGPIFDYPSTERDSYSWVAVDNWISTWELKVTAAAQHAADLYLDLGDPSQAVEVAERMLRVVPTHSGLTETLMRAHAANGDRLAVHRVYQAHVDALEQLDLDAVAESTAELYEQLRSG